MIAACYATGNDALDQLLAALIEHDIDDPDFGPAEEWPDWTDLWRAELDVPLCFTEMIPDQVIHDLDHIDFDAWIELSPDLDTPDDWTPEPDQLPGLPGGLPGEEIPLDPRQPDPDELAEDWEPAPDDDDLADFLERERYEAACRMRFA